MENNIVLTIVLALISNGVLTSLIVTISDVIKKHAEKKSGTAKELGDLKNEIKKINDKLDEHIAQSYRNKILLFQNELFLKRRHTIEEWDEVIEALEKYNKHCKANNVDNEKIQLAEEYIKTVYKQCQLKADFEPMTRPVIGRDEMQQIIAEAAPQE